MILKEKYIKPLGMEKMNVRGKSFTDRRLDVWESLDLLRI